MFLVQNYVECVRGRTEVIHRYRSICRLNVTFHVVLKRNSRIRHQVIKEFCKIQIIKSGYSVMNFLIFYLFLWAKMKRVNVSYQWDGEWTVNVSPLAEFTAAELFSADQTSSISIFSTLILSLSVPPAPSPGTGRFIRLWCRQTVNSLKPANWRLMS